MANCNLRFMDNQKIDSTNVTVTNENSTYPFSNALDFKVRSKIFKSTSNSAWRMTVDLLWSDQVTALCLFAPLGETLGITREATIKLQADNVNDFTSPELDITLSLTSDDKLIHFIDPDVLDVNYRYWSLYIDDPTNPDFISFGICYLGDYTTTQLRNISNGFTWVHRDPTTVQRSINGTTYFDERTAYDTFDGIQYGYVENADRETLEQLYSRNRTFTKMPISLDPDGVTVGNDINTLTRFARFSSPLTVPHRIAGYYNVQFSLEECI